MKRIGYGQVEANHLSARATSQIYAQLPANKDIQVLEQGQYVKYDYANNEVNFTGEGEWMLVYNEIKLYDEPWRENESDFALVNTNYTDKEMTPRVFKTNIGDIYTTNCLEKAGQKGVETTMTDLVVGDILKVNAQGFLAKDGTSDMEWQVVKVYTMPDMQEAVKVMRIK